MAGLLVALLAVAAALLLTLHHGQSAAQKHANTAAAAHAALYSRLYPAFQTAMQSRTAFFVAERNFINAMSDANQKLSSYQSQYNSVQQQIQQINNANSGAQSQCSQPGSVVPCPNPTYPSYPTARSVLGDIGQLRGAVARLSSLNASVLAVTPQSELKTFYAQLEAAITALNTDSQYNADTLAQAVTPGNPNTSGDTGQVDQQKASTLHHEYALPDIRIMNQQAVQLIQLLGLNISQYDVPGGTDADPTDHSVAT